VSVGGLLAFDQVLGKLWSVLTHFWNLTRWSKKERLDGAAILDLAYFMGYVDPVRVPLGFCNKFLGCWPMMSPHV
jgi:hypothetical protein